MAVSVLAAIFPLTGNIFNPRAEIANRKEEASF